MKKGVAQKIATSKGGKSAAKKVLSPEVMGLLSALKQTFECYAGKQQAEEMEVRESAEGGGLVANPPP